MTPADLNPILGLPPSTVWSQSVPDAPLSPEGLADPVVLAWLVSVQRGETEPTLAAACRWECRHRILARYSETDQTNAQRRATVLLRREAVLARAIAAGTATEADIAEHAAVNAEGDALQQADDWINAMQAHWRTLAEAGRSPFSEDAGWPIAP